MLTWTVWPVNDPKLHNQNSLKQSNPVCKPDVDGGIYMYNCGQFINFAAYARIPHALLLMLWFFIINIRIQYIGNIFMSATQILHSYKCNVNVAFSGMQRKCSISKNATQMWHSWECHTNVTFLEMLHLCCIPRNATFVWHSRNVTFAWHSQECHICVAFQECTQFYTKFNDCKKAWDSEQLDAFQI